MRSARRLMNGTAAAVCALAVCAVAAQAEPVRYALDPAHSFVQFEVLHFGTSTLRGRIGPVPGEVVLDRDARRGEVSLRIPLGSLSTGVPLLDKRLAAADLLGTEASPEAYFVASQFRFDADRLTEVAGEFTLRGISRPLTLHAERFACRQDAIWKTEVCGGDFSARLKRSDYGASFGLPLVGDAVRLQIQVEGIRR